MDFGLFGDKFTVIGEAGIDKLGDNLYLAETEANEILVERNFDLFGVISDRA